MFVIIVILIIPVNIGHPLKPGQLTLGKMPRPGLDLTDGLVERHRSLYIAGQFLIADGLHGLAVGRNAKMEKVSDFINPALFYHDVDPFFNAGIQDLPRQAKADDIGIIDKVMSLSLADEDFPSPCSMALTNRVKR